MHKYILRSFWLRIFLLISICGLVWLHTISVLEARNNQRMMVKRRNCYQFPGYLNNENAEILDDILNAKVKPNGGKSIFFLMTGCSEQGEINFSSRYFLFQGGLRFT